MKKVLLKIKDYAKNKKGIAVAALLGSFATALVICFFVYSASFIP